LAFLIIGWIATAVLFVINVLSAFGIRSTIGAPVSPTDEPQPGSDQPRASDPAQGAGPGYNQPPPGYAAVSGPGPGCNESPFGYAAGSPSSPAGDCNAPEPGDVSPEGEQGSLLERPRKGDNTPPSETDTAAGA
jgi:hypothetical protein